MGLTNSQFANPNEVLRPEALTLASHIAAVTTHIGLITTVNTTYSDPYNVARATATIDHLSAGRVGLNIVTGKNVEAARNFGRDQHWDNDRRYDWAAEYIQVLQLLWDSWEDDARVADPTTGQFVDSDRVHQIGFKGEFFTVDGPLNVQRPVQGRLPIINAGASERSRDLGARFSDLRFTNSSTLGLDGARAYYADLKSRLPAYGRTADDQLVIPGWPCTSRRPMTLPESNTRNCNGCFGRGRQAGRSYRSCSVPTCPTFQKALASATSSMCLHSRPTPERRSPRRPNSTVTMTSPWPN